MRPGPDYAKACADATEAQGLAPVVVALAAAMIPVTVDQTGGFIMCARVSHPTDPARWLWITADGDAAGWDALYGYGDLDAGQDDGELPRYLICAYDDDQEGDCIADGAPLADVVTLAADWRNQ